MNGRRPPAAARLAAALAAAWLAAAWLAALAAEQAPRAPRGDLRFESLMDMGRSALQVEDWASARAALEKAVEARPSDVEARFWLSRAYSGDKKYQFASTQLHAVLKLSPGHVPALLDLAAIEENTGRFEAAGARYRRVLETGPSARAERGLASLLAKQGRQEEAIGRLKRLVAADAADHESRSQLGLALMQQGDCASAAAEFAAVAEARPGHLGALYNLGNCLGRTGRRDEAARARARFQTASREEEARVDRRRRAHFLILEASARIEATDLPGALLKLEEAASLDASNARVHAIRGQILDATGDPAGALDAFRRSAAIDPNDAVVQVEVGRLLGKGGRFEEALPWLLRAVELRPEMPEPHLLLAALYRQMGRAREAAAAEQTHRRLTAPGAGPTPPR